MNKTDRIILSTAALLAIAFTVSAQDTGTKEPGPYSIAKQITDPKNGNKPPVFPEETYKPVQVDDDNKLAFAKNISSPFKDGTYWIKLESFATGEASYKMSAEPADIVLVLDLSSSMRNTRGSTYDYYIDVDYSNNNVTSSGSAFTYSSIGNDQYNYYYKIGETLYPVRREQTGNSNNNRRYYLYYFEDTDGDGTEDTGENRYYFNVDGSVITTPNTRPAQGVTAQNGRLYTGVLYHYRRAERIDALREAVKAFIDVIEINDKYEDPEGTIEREGGRLGNRISIITFAGNNYVYTEKTLEEPLSDGSAEELKEKVDQFRLNSQTYTTKGLEYANQQFEDYVDEDRMKKASRTVVLFTDGNPDQSMNSGIQEALKSKTDYKATVFTIGMFSSAPREGDSSHIWEYLNYISSNAPNATATNNAGADFNPDAGFYKDASDPNMDLSSVFEEIAQQSGGDSNTSLTAATSTVDIVSDSFVFPEGIFEEGADINDYVKVFTAKLDKIENGEYVFLEEVMAPYSTDTYDEYEKGVLKREDVDIDGTTDEPTISVVLDGGKTIKVTGFDYANNWCGPVKDEDGQTIDYQGHKMIIMIPIKMNPDAVGGPDVTTNIVGSGIIVPGQTEPIVSFESPTVSLPINLHIEKIGLNPGESAKFRIERAEIPLEGSWSLEEITDWHYVTSIFVTQPQGADPSNKPMVKVRGMASVGKNSDNEEVGYVYKITEEDWSWSYERDATPQYTVTTKVTNPFSFSNTKKKELEYKLRHAESKATNIFKMEGGVIRYDNSK